MTLTVIKLFGTIKLVGNTPVLCVDSTSFIFYDEEVMG